MHPQDKRYGDYLGELLRLAPKGRAALGGSRSRNLRPGQHADGRAHGGRYGHRDLDIVVARNVVHLHGDEVAVGDERAGRDAIELSFGQ